MPNTQSASPLPLEETSFWESALFQFIKFCIVGTSNMVIDVGVSYTLTFREHWLWYFAKAVSFTLGVSNSFYWNSRWTFKTVALTGQQRRFITFVAINMVGLCLTLSIMATIILKFGGMHGSFTQVMLLLAQNKRPLQKKIWLLATGVSTVVVVFWNFFAGRRWSFSE